jgi:hypothetical protein
MNPLIERIYKHVEEDGECWNWTGALQACGASPVMRWQGKTASVRRLIMLDKTQSRIRKNWLASYRCGNPMCVHPEHMGWTFRGPIQRRTTDEQQYHIDVMRCKKLSDKARAKGKLTLELATEIRMAEGNQRQIAAQYGVSQATVSAIKIGKTWRNYSSPFAGLGAR